MSKIKNKNKKHTKDGRTKFNLLKGKNFKFNFKNKRELIVANMELVSGDNELFVVQVKNKSFKLFNKRYLVDETFLTYNRTFKMWESRYHENLCLPVKQIIPAKQITDDLKDVENQDLQDVVNNVDPSILESLVKTQIIQKVFAGEKMQDIFGFIKIMLILIVVGVAICVFVLVSSVV